MSGAVHLIYMLRTEDGGESGSPLVRCHPLVNKTPAEHRHTVMGFQKEKMLYKEVWSRPVGNLCCHIWISYYNTY